MCRIRETFSQTFTGFVTNGEEASKRPSLQQMIAPDKLGDKGDKTQELRPMKVNLTNELTTLNLTFIK